MESDHRAVPRISSFYGVVITMYYRDHEPPHFHAAYGEYSARVLISTGHVLSGRLPARALRLVRLWASQHRDELVANWARARLREPLATIDPLP